MQDSMWLEIILDAKAQELDDICARLIANGVPGLVTEEEGEFQAFLEENRQYWDYVDDGLMEQMKGVSRVKFYVTDEAAHPIPGGAGPALHLRAPAGVRLGP